MLFVSRYCILDLRTNPEEFCGQDLRTNPEELIHLFDPEKKVIQKHTWIHESVNTSGCDFHIFKFPIKQWHKLKKKLRLFV